MVRRPRAGFGDDGLQRPVTPARAAGVIALMALVFAAAYVISSSAGETARAPTQSPQTLTHPTPEIALPASDSEPLPPIAPPPPRARASSPNTSPPPAGSPERPASPP